MRFLLLKSEIYHDGILFSSVKTVEYDITGVLCEKQIWLMTDFLGTLSSVSFTTEVSLASEKFKLQIS